MIELLIYGTGLSFHSVIEVLFFQAPYFVGMFTVFGVLTVYKLMISPFLVGKND